MAFLNSGKLYMVLKSIIILIFTFPTIGFADLSKFKARLYSVKKEVHLLKFRVNFPNARFLTPGTSVKFRTNIGLNYYCDGVVLSKSVNHFLLKVPHIENCSRYQNLSLGINADFISTDLEKNIISAQELINVLNKKRLAIFGKLKRVKKRLTTFVERESAVNFRYDTLSSKLEAERQEALLALESEKIMDTQNFKNFSSKLDEIDFKLEKYRIHDTNDVDERWSLDYSKSELR
tara:strand:+ start:155 stop:856 length:702 start_codon:yes stop_codon:yes gene_type:complete